MLRLCIRVHTFRKWINVIKRFESVQKAFGNDKAAVKPRLVPQTAQICEICSVIVWELIG